MNIFVVVEGDVGEKEVYRSWIPYVNPNLVYVNRMSDINFNNFFIISGGGYPNYYNVIDSAIDDVNGLNNIDKLVISVDSEDMNYDEKLQEIQEFIVTKSCKASIYIIIQHFCLETWALGNRIIIKDNPEDSKLREYKKYFNVRKEDPEYLPGYSLEELNRAQFAAKYLRKAMNDRYRNLTYSKGIPDALLNQRYFDQVRKRCEEINHIQSFNDFLSVFQN